jgi:hypothetical protein
MAASPAKGRLRVRRKSSGPQQLDVDVGQFPDKTGQPFVLVQAASNNGSVGLADVHLPLVLLPIHDQVGVRAVFAPLMAGAARSRAGGEPFQIRPVKQSRQPGQISQQRGTFPAQRPFRRFHGGFLEWG